VGPKDLSAEVSSAAGIYGKSRTLSQDVYRNSRRELNQRSTERREIERNTLVASVANNRPGTGNRIQPQTSIVSPQTSIVSPQASTVAPQIQHRSKHGDSRGPARIAHFDLKHKHVHGASCGHHNYGGRWHDYPRAHRHGSSCGHHFSGGAWISFSIGHRHGIGCGHFHEGGRWLSHLGHHHVHGVSCGHYYYSSLWWNYPRLHSHFDGCGHYYHSSRWYDFPVAHIHSSSCGHLYDGLSWYAHGNQGHIHGANCGHHYYERRWNSYPRGYYTRHRHDSFYFFVDLGDFRRRNVSTHVYEESLDYGNEPVDIFNDEDALSRAYAAFNAGKFYESVIAFNQAIEEDPENGILYIARAQAQVAIRDYRSAYDDLIIGLEMVPEWSEVELNLAEIYGNPDWFQDHYDNLNKWVGEYPRDYKAHFVLGYFHYFRQDYEAAKSEFVYTLAWDEEHPQAKQMMESILVFEAETEVMAAENELLEDVSPEKEL
tara:strand:- start:2130 stop:3587 length:1458 start_codon:yes stop_codon:yes gene_type:complete